jgi:hypothetical protein
MGLLVVIAILGIAVYFVLIWRPTLPAITRPDPRSFPTALVERAILAQLGDCDVCHTAEGGARYAGARGLPGGASHPTTQAWTVARSKCREPRRRPRCPRRTARYRPFAYGLGRRSSSQQ